MNRYEMVNIIDVNWKEGDQAAAEELVREEIGRGGGEVEDVGGMGRRRLAYEINDHGEGLYLISHFLYPPDEIASLQQRFKLNPAVLRTLVVRKNTRTETSPVEFTPKEPESEKPEEAPKASESEKPEEAPEEGEDKKPRDEPEDIKQEISETEKGQSPRSDNSSRA